jgi:Na+-translocating ferredoxin:NAD+ oxidoreductase subunit E
VSRFGQEFAKGLIITNPVFVLLLGLCPSLAVSTSIDNALGMSLAVLIVLLGSNIIIAAIRGFVPSITRIPIFIVIIATLVTVVNLLFNAYLPDIHETLGIYLPLVVVNCIVLGRAEAFASKSSVRGSVADALGMTVGFMLALLIISFIRQLLGTGELSVFGVHLFSLPGLSDHPLAVFILPPGGFLVIGLLLGLFKWTGVLKR